MENNNYFKGFIGSLVGALVFSIPWLLMYVYGGYILSILAFVIGIGSFKFYKMFGGIVTKKTPIIIVISSILIITLLNFVVIPLFLLYKEGMGIDLSYLSSLYSNSEFVSAMLGDYLISVLFTFLGIGGVIKSINYEAYGVIDNREYIDDKSETEQIKDLESVYDKFGAYDKRSAIPVSVLTSYIKSKRINSFMEKFYKKGIIVNTGMNKSYFDKEAIVNEEKASSNSKKYKRKSIKVVFITLIIIFFAVLLGFMSSEESGPVNYKEYKYKNITVSLPSYFELDDESEYYNYFTAEARNDVGVEASMLEVYDIVFTKEEIMNGLKDDYDVLEMNEYTLCGLEGYLIKCKYKEFSFTNDWYFMVNDGVNTYGISFIFNDAKKDLFMKEYDYLVKSIKITTSNNI